MAWTYDSARYKPSTKIKYSYYPEKSPKLVFYVLIMVHLEPNLNLKFCLSDSIELLVR